MRARAPAACSRRRHRCRAPLSRPGPSARRLSRFLGPTHLLRRRPGPAAGPDAAAGVAAATRAGRAAAERAAAAAGTRSTGRAVAAVGGAAAEAAPRTGRPQSGPPPSLRAGEVAAWVPATPPQVWGQAVTPARNPLWAREGREGGGGGPAYPAAWRLLRSPWRPGGPAPAAPRRRLFLSESFGEGGGRRCASARNPSSHAAGGGGARRTKREERGRRGGGPGAKGQKPGLGRAEAKGRNWQPPIGGASVLLDARWDWPDR